MAKTKPPTVTEVRSFLGLVYSKRFVMDFSSLTAMMTKLTHKDEKFEWTKE